MVGLVGVVEKPQFDISVFKPGKAIHVKHSARSNGYGLMDVDGLIGRVNPLEIIVWTYSKNEDECEYVDVPIAEVITGEYEITLLQEVK